MASSAVNQLPVYLPPHETLGEAEAVGIFLNAGLQQENITLLHCLSAYPAPEDKSIYEP